MSNKDRLLGATVQQTWVFSFPPSLAFVLAFSVV